MLDGTGILVRALALRQFASIIGPVLLALILVIGVHPLTGVLRRRGAPMWLAATVTLITLGLVIFGLATWLAQSMVAQPAALIPAHPDRFTALTNDQRAWLGSIGVDPDQLRAALNEINFANTAALVADLLTGGLVSVFSNTLFLLFAVAFMAIDLTGFARRLARAKRQRAYIVGAPDTFAHGIRSYSLVSTVSETSLWVQTATSDTGVTTQPTTISTTAMAERQRIRGRRRPISARSVAFSRRICSSSGALVGRQVVLDVEGCVPAAERLGHLGPPDRRG